MTMAQARVPVFTVKDSEKVYALAERQDELGRRTKEAIQTLEDAIKRYGAESLALSFNGGKDCTVLVHIFAAILHRIHQTSTSAYCIPSLYVQCPAPFPQVEEFVHYSITRYSLSLRTITSDLKSALSQYLSFPTSSSIRAIVIGTRRTDPNGRDLEAFKETDGDWPRIMRVHPILDWSYRNIWDFLRASDLAPEGPQQPPYQQGIGWCNLYDYGYTSLGSTFNTFPNPMLREETCDHTVKGWKPAWLLEDENQERAGRGKPPQSWERPEEVKRQDGAGDGSLM
ncbi:adenine nucleotide alpha hydrolases-like protein [Atractiella rhizophila]|nr:adenine nucleotide alpha hydrolases-like protein [Atractiella rhizophila]